MATSLYDPGGAQFRKLKSGSSADFICGQVNSKNRLGAYAGFKEFVASLSQERATISTTSIGVRDSEFKRLYMQHCASPAELQEEEQEREKQDSAFREFRRQNTYNPGAPVQAIDPDAVDGVLIPPTQQEQGNDMLPPDSE